MTRQRLTPAPTPIQVEYRAASTLSHAERRQRLVRAFGLVLGLVPWPIDRPIARQ